MGVLPGWGLAPLARPVQRWGVGEEGVVMLRGEERRGAEK